MLTRALPCLLLAVAGAAASSSFHQDAAIDLSSTEDIAANSKLGSMIMSKARQLNNNNNNNNYDMTWVSGYSIKFQQCTATDNYYGGYFGGNGNNNENNNNKNNYNGMYEQRLVHFKLCPSSSCSNNCEGGADYVVDMAEFVNAYVESKLTAQEYNCERVRENCYCENNNNNNGYSCEYYCYQNAGLDYCYNNNNNNNNNKNQFNIQEALECRKLEVNQDALDYYYYSNNKNANNGYYQNQNAKMEFFVGPYCAKGGKKILLGVFMEETCSFTAPEGIYEKLNYGQKLPYSSESLVENTCLSCKEPTDSDEQNDYDQEDADAVTDVCERLYGDAGKCESGLSNVAYPNNYACDFIKTLPKASYWNIQPKAVPAKVLAGVFAATTVMTAGLAIHLHRKIQMRRNADLSQYEIA